MGQTTGLWFGLGYQTCPHLLHFSCWTVTDCIVLPHEAYGLINKLFVSPLSYALQNLLLCWLLVPAHLATSLTFLTNPQLLHSWRTYPSEYLLIVSHSPHIPIPSNICLSILLPPKSYVHNFSYIIPHTHTCMVDTNCQPSSDTNPNPKVSDDTTFVPALTPSALLRLAWSCPYLQNSLMPSATSSLLTLRAFAILEPFMRHSVINSTQPASLLMPST